MELKHELIQEARGRNLDEHAFNRTSMELKLASGLFYQAINLYGDAFNRTSMELKRHMG